MGEFMCAGAVFNEPEEGDFRIVVSMISHFAPRHPNADDEGYINSPGLMVQEYGPRYSKDGFELCGGGKWRFVCPLVDANIHGCIHGLPSMRRFNESPYQVA